MPDYGHPMLKRLDVNRRTTIAPKHEDRSDPLAVNRTGRLRR